VGVTYTPALERHKLRSGSAVARHLGSADIPLVVVSVLAIVMLLYVSTARLRTVSIAESATGTRPVDLNTVTDVARLEQLVSPISQSPPDRRLAARELLAFLVQADGGRRTLPNVGMLARARVSVAAITQTPGATVYQERLNAERARATASNAAPPESVALFTSTDLAAIKPLAVVRERGDFLRRLFFWALVYCLAFHAVSIAWRLQGVHGDRILLAAAHALTALGFAAMASRPDPLRDLMLFVRYAQGVVAGLALLALLAAVKKRTALLGQFSYLPLAGAVVLSVILILFGDGPSGSNAKVNLGPVQPIEGIRLLLALFLAGYFARRWELLRAVRSPALGGYPILSRFNVPRLTYVVPVLLGVFAALTLFFVQKDLGPALMLAVVFLATYAIARGTIGMALTGLALVASGFYLGYALNISATLADRVRMWQSPWDNIARGGDQVAQALWALAAGGPFGTGIGLGDTRYLPAGHTDLILAALGEELGAVGLLAVAAMYAAVIWRALVIARRAVSDYDFFLAVVLTLSLSVPVFLMAGGMMGLVPLTGVVTPFLSFGGSAMVANFLALGLLAGMRTRSEPAVDLDVFRPGLTWLSGALMVCAVVVVVGLLRVQVVSADEVLVKPHLGVQADGTRRYQYNPRMLDVARGIPRGSVVDRNGLPLATDDLALQKQSASAYQKLGITLDAVCPDPSVRCYPLGGRAYHLLGDARTRPNWSATNTSFVERDSESRLRGFDDRSAAIRVVDASGSQTSAMLRDYSDLVPLFRHRYQPTHPDAKAILGRSRDARLTIDARLQIRVADILSEYSRRSSTGHAAAVVLDPASGDVLASVSYPWPSELPVLPPTGSPPREDLLDRARYGLYPPGSTFKLLTAAAALRRDPNAHRTTFTCSRLSDGRVGAVVPGWGRPVRDDVLDRHPHGDVGMHRALVTSCNAYFAQLAARLGPDALLDAAGRADVPLAKGNALSRIRDTLPQIGYGQGEVVTTPLRMARVAAAIAADGRIRDPRLDRDGPLAASGDLMSSSAARLLAGYMRDAVLDGTGRSLRGNDMAIAGKTGTAELTGASSHAWFVGFAPYGRATKRVAVAVIIENAGYGGSAAAPAAGEIVNAAAALGLAAGPGEPREREERKR
jgi:cell division protein FtsW (lipid II flippase)